MNYKPTSITKVMSNQLSYLNISFGQMFYCTDSNSICYDTQDLTRIYANDIIILQFEYQRNNYIPDKSEYFATEVKPYFVDNTDYSWVYVAESNSLYKYQNNIWNQVYGRYGVTNVAQTYYPDGTLQVVTTDDVTTNGILNNGSVVVRDNNKMICGLLHSDGYVFHMNSLIGGQMNLNPSGKDTSDGCLQLNSGKVAYLNGDLILFGDIYTAKEKDWNKQYRLITETVEIVETSVIKQGSTLIKGSSLNDNKYSKDTILDTDIQCTTGQIIMGSKIYMDSVINNKELKGPFLFDTDNFEQLTKIAN